MSERQFDIMKNGYNRYQVEDYLDDLENRMAMLHRKVDMYRQRSEEVEKQLNQIKEEYHHVVHNLSMKEKAAEEMARIAMKEANVIVDTAQMNADVIVKEALMTARSILLDIAKLGNEASELKGTMYEQLESLSKALDAFEVPPIPDMDLLKEKEIQ
ncbi:MAG: DivIVA domain-containing protein [Erysipelotrichaceae bacterium]|nr:DivIVA domain-containing protein [Erysipelotrichaceae bacterium]